MLKHRTGPGNQLPIKHNQKKPFNPKLQDNIPESFKIPQNISGGGRCRLFSKKGIQSCN